ncbi:MAG: DUF1919 domain-containing protein [Ruminococcus sp.]|nr:DUF1919 domain-containing protein [Ruminococcus sp.]
MNNSFYNNWRRRILSRIVKKKLDLSDVSLISMNCVGGIMYHDCESRFLTPTIDLYFSASDFIKFVNNLDLYLAETPRVIMGSKFPIGVLGDIKLYFMHYDTPEEALAKWEERKKRINNDKIFVIMVDRNGFSDEDFENFKKIHYPKFLLTNKKEHAFTDSVYMPKYKDLDEMPDVIPGRRMYYKMALPNAIKKAYSKHLIGAQF